MTEPRQPHSDESDATDRDVSVEPEVVQDLDVRNDEPDAIAGGGCTHSTAPTFRG